MVISVKDGFKLVAISIVCACAVFVCTFMLNFYIDVLPLDGTLNAETQILFDAQLATAKFTSAISGGFLGVIAVIMTVFYIKIYVDAHSKQLGVLKAMGYSNGKLALRFWVFGLCVFAGCAVGFAGGFIAMPAVYAGLTIDGLPSIEINFHPVLLICLVIIPTLVFAGISCLYAYISLHRPVGDMLKGTERIKLKKSKNSEGKDRSFLVEMGLKTLSSKKTLAFFVAFASFCFSAMVQMGLSMENLTTKTMGLMILVIGVILAVVSILMAITSLIRGNAKTVSIMKAFGYSLKECTLAIFAVYAPIAVLGFGIGTVYQYGLLQLMVNLVFKGVGNVPEYSFNIPVFFITLAIFIVACALITFVFSLKLNKISVKEVMSEN